MSNVNISTAAVLVELSISVWTGRKLDKQASDGVVRNALADKGVANVHKKLLGDCEELTNLQKFVGNARNVHYSLTMPWSDTGIRLLPTTALPDYQARMTALEYEFDTLVNTFLQAYDWEVSEAQVRLGALFKADEYPTADSLRDKFRWRASFLPIPAQGDFRVDIAEEQRKALSEQYSKFYDESIAKAMRDAFDRAESVMTRVIDRLTDVGGKKQIFRDTLVDSAVDVANMLHSFNLTDDPAMREAAERLASAMRGVSVGDLREDAALRAKTRSEVQAALDALGMDW